jgi:hypothetical protein
MTAQASAENGAATAKVKAAESVAVNAAESGAATAAESSAVTPASVKPGLGYPNDRVEQSTTPIGWHGLDNEEIDNVSRETSAGSLA